MKQVLTITNGVTPVLVATTQINLIDDIVLVNTNWDLTTITIETAPKLIGEGSYEISTSVPERVLEITLNSIGNWTLTQRALTTLAIAKTELTFTKVKTETADNKTETQVLKGKITSIAPDQAFDNWADIKLTILCKDPTPVTTIT
jgi:hypothetical protein